MRAYDNEPASRVSHRVPAAKPHHLRRGPLLQTYFAAHSRSGIRQSSWPCFCLAPVAIGCIGAGAISSGSARQQLGHKDRVLCVEGLRDTRPKAPLVVNAQGALPSSNTIASIPSRWFLSLFLIQCWFTKNLYFKHRGPHTHSTQAHTELCSVYP